MTQKLILSAFLLFSIAFGLVAQCDLVIDYDASGNRIFRGNACAPDCSTHVVNTEDDGEGSLRRAVFCAEDGDNVTFETVLSGVNIDLTTNPLFIDKTITLNWPVGVYTPVSNLRLRANQGILPLEIALNRTVSIEEINLISRNPTSPRTLWNKGILTLKNLELIDDANYKGLGSTLLNQGNLNIKNNVKIRYVYYN